MSYLFENHLAFARLLDEKDSLFNMRHRFYLNPGEIYMDGNSLGLASKDAEDSLLNLMTIWRNEGIRIWGTEEGKYFNYSRFLAEHLKALIHADADEIAVMGSITSNILQALATFYQPTKEKYKIIVDALNFPTDIYAVKSMIALKGFTVEEALITVPSQNGRTLSEEQIISYMSEDVALILLPSVLYRSSQLLDMKRITDEAHKRDIYMGWDLAHSIGCVPHDFKEINPDFAVWCSYKYLNGGPGAAAGLYINKRHFSKTPGFMGWFGNKNESQFLMNHNFDQDPSANGWLLGTHHLFSMAPIEGALKPFNEIGIHAIRKKSLLLTTYLMDLIDDKLSVYGYVIGNPKEDSHRGGHVSLEHEEAYRISLALRDLKIIPDYREPNVIRLAPIALYTSFEEIYHVVDALISIMVNKLYLHYPLERVTVL